MLNRNYYKNKLEEHKYKPNYLRNMIYAFLFGGFIAIIGQSLIELYSLFFNDEMSRSLMTVTLIFISSLLTALGIFDSIGQIALAGTIVPITGFANSLTSAALESKQEGIVLGIGCNMFKLAGTVITFGIVSAYFLGIIRYLVGLI